MPLNFEGFTTDEEIDAPALNARFSDLDDAIEALVDGSKTLSAPTIAGFDNAQHNHTNGANGGQLPLGALDVSGETNGDVLQVSDGTLVAAPIGVIPTGAVMPFAGSTAPSGYLLCDGQAVSRAAYSNLFAVISTTYGVGDGATTFNVPDLRGRVAAGLDNMGGNSADRVTDTEADSLGGSVGAETHTLIEDEMPVHNHNMGGEVLTGQAGIRSWNSGSSGNRSSTLTTGGGAAHNNMQPTLFLNYIIKT